eukprot:CAMPEP_0198266966 /NCGR_PEP_ID=MMETSP1447-20131203/30942_1 /TAXON_ID=420782 /ORGANISM="Chaetoceros dichaeta, Strain CCMP1751" /LENGTH=308 /DNA_ID=CAMNT_0043957303 /DNA_START=101 /DNA_END=1027 /DNA_ORIENTATION=+
MSKLAGTFFTNLVSMKGKVAVITGAASGIGLEFSRRCVISFGMHVVMADIDDHDLTREVNRINTEVNGGSSGGGRAIAVRTDVRKRDHYVRLLDVAQRASPSGCIDVCLFNAGVLGAGVQVLKGNENDWRWVLDVNLFGVLHGLQVFTPAIAKQTRPGLIAVTASDRGLDIGGSPGCTASYATSKHGLMGMCESLEGELAAKNLGGQIQLSILCPGLVASSLWNASKAEEQRLVSDKRTINYKKGQQQFMESLGTSVSDTIDTFLDGVTRGKFICDSVPGQAQESFGRRAEYIAGGLMPSDRRLTSML